MDPVSNQVAQQAANQASQQAAPATEVKISDQARFDDAMQQPEQVENAQPKTEATNGDPTPEQEATLGDPILNGIEKMKTSHDVRSARIEDQLTNSIGKDLSVQDCMKLQFEVMQMSMEQELTGKIADKTSQGVQTLFQNQYQPVYVHAFRVAIHEKHPTHTAHSGPVDAHRLQRNSPVFQSAGTGSQRNGGHPEHQWDSMHQSGR